MSTTGSPANVPENKKLYWLLWWSGLAIIGTLLMTALLTRGVMLFKVGSVEFDCGLTALELATFYVILSFKTAPTDTAAGAYCYGKALVRLGSGPHFVPFCLMQFRKEYKAMQEVQCPGEPETVFHGHDSDPLPDGMVRPIRVMTRKIRDCENGILDVQMTLVVSFVIQYAISDILDFLTNLRNTEEFKKQARDVCEILVGEIASGMTPNEIIEQLPKINGQLTDKLKERLEHLGVKIISARMLPPDVSDDVSVKLAGIAAEKAAAQQTVIKADAEKIKLEKEGVGKASAKQKMLEAEAIGRKKMMTELKVSGSEVLAAETANALVNAGTVVVGAGGGMQDLMGVVKAAQVALQPKGGTKK